MTRKIFEAAIKKTAILVFCFVSIASQAQLNVNNLTRFSEQDGLPSSQVPTIIADKLGYIWMGTLNGLTRYDGYEFKRFYFNPNDSASIHGLNVQSLYEDREGKIWVCASPSYLNMYDPATTKFTQYPFTHLIKHPPEVELEIYSVCEDDKGRLYFGASSYRGETVSASLMYKDPNDDSLKLFVTPDSLDVHNAYSIIKDKSGNIFFLSEGKLFKIDTSRHLSRVYVSVPETFSKKEEHFADAKFDQDGNLWIIGCRSTLLKVSLKDNSIKIFAPPGVHSDENFYNSILFDKNRNLWMGTNKGLMRFNTTAEQFEFFNDDHKNQFIKSSISSIKFDAFGNLWIASWTDGVSKYEERAAFRSFSYNKEDKNSLTPGWVNLIFSAGDHKIWAASSGSDNVTGGGLNVLDISSNTLKSMSLRSFMPGSWLISGGIEMNPGELLLNSNTGNWLYSTKTNTFQKAKLNGMADSIWVNHFYKDSKGNLWACTLKGLFKKNKDAEMFTRYELNTIPGSNQLSNEITKAIESPKHGLWLTTNNGLFLYSYTTDKIERHGFDKTKGDIFLTQDVNSLYEDKDGMVWVGTWQGGLSMYNVETKKIQTYTQNDGLPSMSIQGILADEKNNALWLSTFEGLSRMDLNTKQFNNFSVADGIQSPLFADGAALKTQDGFFVFGGSNGITVFNPDSINKLSKPPIVLLTDLKLSYKSVVPGEKSILKKPVYDTKEISLSYNQNNISLEFVAIHYSNPSKNKYAYKLENYDNEWHDIGNQHAAFYPNLPPGRYVFHVIAANNNGVWNEEGATLTIIVNPPWWKTTAAYILYGLLFIAFSFAANRYLRSRLLKKEREKSQARELAQAREIEKAYNELKTTQAQLIQSEKMASLGELTAGIAHEIQNPLNFVNNFSEVNNELAEELKNELAVGNLQSAKEIANDIKDNSEKINHHGKRADSIVKGMLQHSRKSTGEKELTDINALADEYLRLSYHGLRAKDPRDAAHKSFNATIHTDFDSSIGKIKIIPQDLGRVLLNLYNNAFYAVQQKKNDVAKGTSASKEPTTSYEPTVTVKTFKTSNGIQIKVSDNGNGIPQNIIDKIFQPFFTTKPTGSGTGLGLSLSYDIVKAHGGEILVQAKEGEGSEFTIVL